MNAVARFLSLGASIGLAIATGVSSASAVEPQAPDQLITAQEAVLISIRSQLQQVKLPSRPTQTEKGDAIDRSGLAGFYAALGDEVDSAKRQPLWVAESGLTDRAKAAIREIQNAAEWGLPADAFALPDDLESGSRPLSARELVALEMQMSLAILKYARYARGGQMDPTDLSLDIDRKPPLLAADVVLRGAHEAEDVAAYLRDLHPKHEQFVKLRAAYLKALDDEADRSENAVEGDRRDTNKPRRSARGETPLSKRLLYNMEMWRWMPEQLGATYIMPNVPEFRIRVVRDSEIVHSERMITGKIENKTPIFSDELKTVVFRPNWGIPNSIKVKDVLPKIMRGQSIERQGFRVQASGRDIDPRSVDWSRADIRNYHVYQPPGERNALGLVKFMFPNKHAVYFHDTPSKYLFDKQVRAFSHGCMRVRDPMKLATVILGMDRGWGRGKIDALAGGADNQEIALSQKIPVHITYFTARANQDGEIELVNDIYGHEKLIQLGFDGQAHTIVKEDRSLDKYLEDRVGVRDDRVAIEAPRRERSRQWMRSVWSNND